MYKLRDSPYIPDESGKKEDNVIAEYPYGSVGFAMGKSKDSTGREWWFVAMKNNPEFKSKFFHATLNNGSKYYVLGWMSSNYLEEINLTER